MIIDLVKVVQEFVKLSGYIVATGVSQAATKGQKKRIIVLCNGLCTIQHMDALNILRHVGIEFSCLFLYFSIRA